MKLTEIRALHGPNVYHHRPVLKALVDLEDYAETASTSLPNFTARVLALLPGLVEHHCSEARPGGFVERLKEGTYFAHIIEHVALELTDLAGVPVSFGKSRRTRQETVYEIVIRFEAEQATTFLLGAALNLVACCAEGRSFKLEPVLSEARRLAANSELGPSTNAILAAARRRNVPYRRLNDGSLLQLGYGVRRRLLQATESDATASIAVDIASNKDLTKKLLREAALPVPEGAVVNTFEELLKALPELKAPYVVKPLDANQGRGVSLNLRTVEELERAFKEAKQFSPQVILEELLAGRDYRVLVVAGRVVAASERVPAHVIGDGRSTIAELIEKENGNPQRGSGHAKPLTTIHIDDKLTSFLARSSLTLSSVPADGDTVFVRETANISTGGSARDVTDLLHPQIARACIRAAAQIGLNICGIDLIMPDISRPFGEDGCGIIEINAAPGIRMHEFPARGASRSAGEAIFSTLYPQGQNGRIPIAAVTGTNGKTTVARMLAAIISSSGRQVGLTSSDGIFIGDNCIQTGDTTGYHSALAVLCDPTVDTAVLEVARGGLLRNGLAYDWSDLAILTNIQPDHLGQDEIGSLEDLVWIKSLVAERVRPGGTLILNGDDTILRNLPERPNLNKTPRQIIYFSVEPDNDFVHEHITRGGTAYCLEGDWLIECKRPVRQKIMRVNEVPQAANGLCAFQIANALAALAAGRALGLSLFNLRHALGTFSAAKNPGRLNWYTVNGAHVLVDYAHNPGAFNGLRRLISQWEGKRTAILGLPGDRTNELLEESALINAQIFDKIIVREDQDTRGRPRGELAALIRETVKRNFPLKPCSVVLDEGQALAAALSELEPGELLVVFYEELEAVRAVLRDSDAEFLTDFQPGEERPARTGSAGEARDYL